MNETIKILFLASNPSDTVRLRLDEEVRRIDQVLRMASYRDRFVIKNHGAVRISDLQELLFRHQPHIIHFSGHGSPQGEIILMNEVGNSVTVPPRALSALFKIWKKTISCVVLNACYSETQAQAIAEHIDCVIGMSKAIGDEPSICFSSAFYQALGYDKSLKDAFDSGRLEIALHDLRGEDIPEINGNKEKLANTYLLSEIRQAALENQLNKILPCFHSKQYKQTAQLCKLILESNPEHAEANLVAAICLLEGRSGDEHPRRKIRQVESYLNKAMQYQSTANVAWIIMGLVKCDHYRDESEGEPTMDEIKRSIDANLTQSDNYYLSHINASPAAYSSIGINKPNKEVGNLTYGTYL